ncbi:hypothetical protein J7I80_11610 [Bacillus sp. ISL-41]|uniref:hypothetical protein n=1 Tax=Bacillus sp. ISL-41 TaxID=2819127 RepID=UPI001BE5468C|nr:hypothetical protein [Bacillus sp. ISL-41]MBT2642875.1 hypothetical protein [Bacillus sp. ISL-41]
MTIKSAVIESFAEYSQFGSLKEFNNHFEMWMADKKRFFSKGELIGLKRLARFAAKVPGVANAKIGTVLKAIYEEYGEMGISRSTFKRMILKASEIGIFIVYETARKNGSQSSNLYVFNRFPMNELPAGDQLSHQYKTIIPSETNIKKNNKREEKAAEEQLSEITVVKPLAEKAPEDHLFVSDRVPSDFVNLVKYFYPSTKSIEEFWRMSMVAAYRNNYEKDTDLLLSLSLDSFRQLVRKLKSKVEVKNPIAYFTGILNKKFQERYFEELYDMQVC